VPRASKWTRSCCSVTTEAKAIHDQADAQLDQVHQKGREQIRNDPHAGTKAQVLKSF